MEIIAELIVKDVDESISFYKQLGFDLEYKDGNVWAQMKRDGNRIMFEDHKSVLNELKEIKQLGNSILLMLKDTKEIS